MAFNVRKRGKLTYYYEGDRPVLSALVTEEQADGDLKIHFAGLTGGYSAKGVLGLDKLVSMDPHQEVALVFRCWEKWLVEAEICSSLRDIDFVEMHAFGAQPKTPNILADPPDTPLSRIAFGKPMPRRTHPSSPITFPRMAFPAASPSI